MQQKTLRKRFAEEQKAAHLDQNETMDLLFEEGVSDLGAAAELTRNSRGSSAESGRGHRPASILNPIGTGTIGTGINTGFGGTTIFTPSPSNF